jgi:hypothetical protein
LIALYMAGLGGRGSEEGPRELLEQSETFDKHRAEHLVRPHHRPKLRMLNGDEAIS